jgi:hypothetical protein
MGGSGGINDVIWYAPAIRQIVRKDIQQQGFGVNGGNQIFTGGHRYAKLERWELVDYKLD